MRNLFEKEWKYVGLDCAVVFGEIGGIKTSRCGYVRVLEKHPLFRVHYNKFSSHIGNIDDVFDVHGGVTFSGEFSVNSGKWWIGFDCAHSGDRKHPNFEEWEEKQGITRGSEWNAQFRELDYVVKETNKLADALSKCESIKRQ